MTLTILSTLAYLLIGTLAFFMVRHMEGYNPKRWVPTFILTVFLWPLVWVCHHSISGVII